MLMHCNIPIIPHQIKILITISPIRWNVIDVIDPIHIRQIILIVKDRRVPISIRGEDTMGKRVHFFVCRWSHVKVGKSVLKLKREKISVTRNDALTTVENLGLIENLLFEVLELTRRVDGLSLSMVGILVHDQHNFAFMRLDLTSHSTNT